MMSSFDRVTDQITRLHLTAEQADIVLSFLEQVTAALWEVHEDQLVDLVLQEAPPEDDLDLFLDGRDSWVFTL
jgi:hypothetical protein